MSKNVLSIVLFSLFLGCEDKSRPLGGGSLQTPVGGDGEGEGSLTDRIDAGPGEGTVGGEGEGDGTVGGEGEGGSTIAGEGEGPTSACNPACIEISAQEDWISDCVSGICQCFRNMWRECGASCQQFGDDMRCISDFCAAPAIGFIVCNSLCVDSFGNNAHCGACGNACRANEQCIDGQCRTCPDARERWCPKRWEGFECINVQNHPANCGACGIWCNDFGYLCVNGACVCKLDADRCVFEGADICTDLTRDWNNCGECGRPCPRGSECPHGQCGECMQSWDQEQCNGDCIVCDGMADVTEGFDSACVVTATDEINCGECGNRCANGERCEEGRCQ